MINYLGVNVGHVCENIICQLTTEVHENVQQTDLNSPCRTQLFIFISGPPTELNALLSLQDKQNMFSLRRCETEKRQKLFS